MYPLKNLFEYYDNVVFTGWLDQSKLNALYKISNAILL